MFSCTLAFLVAVAAAGAGNDGAGILDDDTHKRRNVAMAGNIALQLHTGDDLYMQFKELYVKPAVPRE